MNPDSLGREEFAAQINLKMSSELKERLNRFYKLHKITPVDLLRGLAEADCDASEAGERFSFPIKIVEVSAIDGTVQRSASDFKEKSATPPPEQIQANIAASRAKRPARKAS